MLLAWRFLNTLLEALLNINYAARKPTSDQSHPEYPSRSCPSSLQAVSIKHQYFAKSTAADRHSLRKCKDTLIASTTSIQFLSTEEVTSNAARFVWHFRFEFIVKEGFKEKHDIFVPLYLSEFIKGLEITRLRA